MDIFELSSRFHLTAGSGLPVALHISVTLTPSRTTMSVDVTASSMFGGTMVWGMENNGNVLSFLNHIYNSLQIINIFSVSSKFYNHFLCKISR